MHLSKYRIIFLVTLTFLAVGVIEGILFRTMAVRASGGANLGVNPVTVGTDDIIGAANANWKFTVTTTQDLVRGDVVQFTFPSVSDTNFNLTSVTSTSISGVTLNSALGTNLFANASFENGTNSWTVGHQTASSTATATTTAYSGSSAEALYVNNTSTFDNVFIQQSITAPTSSSYTVSFYARGLNGSETARLVLTAQSLACASNSSWYYNFTNSTWTCVNYANTANFNASSPYVKNFSTTQSFQRFSLPFTSIASTTPVTVQLLVGADASYAGQTVIYDAVQLESGSTATPFNLGTDMAGVGYGGTNNLTVYGIASTTIPAGTAFSVTLGGITNASDTPSNVSNLTWTVKAGTPSSAGSPAGSLSSTKFSQTATSGLQAYNLPPTNASTVTASTTTSTVGLTWSSGNGRESMFVIQRAGSDGVYSQIATTTTSTHSYTATGLTPSASYTFRVAASDNGVHPLSSFSTASAVYTLANQPVATDASVNNASTITISWSTNGNASGTEYEVTNTTASTTSGWVADMMSYAFTGLTCNTNYSFTVEARNSDHITTTNDTAAAKTSPCYVGAGGGAAPAAPVLVPLPTADTGASSTAVTVSTNPNSPSMLTLHFSVAQANQVAVAEDPSFAGTSWEPYKSDLSYQLKNPKATVLYVKFRSAQGGETKVQQVALPATAASPSTSPVVAPQAGPEALPTTEREASVPPTAAQTAVPASPIVTLDAASPIQVTNLPNVASFKPQQVIHFHYGYTNTSPTVERIQVIREVVNSDGRVLARSTALRTLMPGRKFLFIPRQSVTKQMAAGEYTMSMRVVNRTTGEVLAENGFVFKVATPKIKK